MREHPEQEKALLAERPVHTRLREPQRGLGALCVAEPVRGPNGEADANPETAAREEGGPVLAENTAARNGDAGDQGAAARRRED